MLGRTERIVASAVYNGATMSHPTNRASLSAIHLVGWLFATSVYLPRRN